MGHAQVIKTDNIGGWGAILEYGKHTRKFMVELEIPQITEWK